jgi:8-oxo-dGTP pyrophosphatase MutT (NUDIX family)
MGALVRGRRSRVAVLAVNSKRPGKLLLITSRNSKSWSLPKGRLDPLLSPVEAGRREAFEEAGVIGRLSARSLGNFTHRDSRGETFRVRVFKMHVQRELLKWPENIERQRKWVTLEMALEMISNPSLRRFIRSHFVGCRYMPGAT